MLVTADTQLIDSVGVGEANQFDLVEHHEKGVDDAVLGCQDAALFQAVRVDHLAAETAT